jgi:hypothetical protein
MKNLPPYVTGLLCNLPSYIGKEEVAIPYDFETTGLQWSMNDCTIPSGNETVSDDWDNSGNYYSPKSGKGIFHI